MQQELAYPPQRLLRLKIESEARNRSPIKHIFLYGGGGITLLGTLSKILYREKIATTKNAENNKFINSIHMC